jgi:hypothetical protein
LQYAEKGGRAETGGGARHCEEEALKKGMEAKSKEFLEKGAEIYEKA